MDKEKLLAEVCEVIANHLMLEKVEDVVAESDLQRDLHADSLDRVELCFDFEEKYDIAITDSQLAGVKTVQDIVDLIAKIKAD